MLHRALPWVPILLLVGSVGLATTDDRQVSPDELLAGAALELDPRPPALISSDEVMVLSDEMREFLDRHVAKRAEDSVKLRQLTSAVIDKEKFGIKYEDLIEGMGEPVGAATYLGFVGEGAKPIFI